MDVGVKRKSSESEEDVPEEDQIFSHRIKRFPVITPEEVEKMMKEHEEKDKEITKEIEIEVEVVKPTRGRRGRGRGRASRGKAKAKFKIKKTPEEVLLQAAEENFQLPRASKRRLQRLQETEAHKLKQIEEENARLLSYDILDDDLNFEEVVNVESPSPQKNSEISLKVHHLADIKRIKCNQTEKFSTIFCKVADAFNLKASEVLLCHKDRNILVDDTPSSLNIKFYDLIECLQYKAEKNENELDDNQIKVKMQSNDNKKKIEMAIHRLESMQEVMGRYAKLRNIPLERMVFEFDGEKIEGTETAEDLEMESGSCIDVKIAADKSQNSEVEMKKKESKKEKVAVVDIDDDSSDSLGSNMLQVIDIL